MSSVKIYYHSHMVTDKQRYRFTISDSLCVNHLVKQYTLMARHILGLFLRLNVIKIIYFMNLLKSKKK